MGRDSLRLGMSGNATAFAENTGVIGLLGLNSGLDQRLYRLPLTPLSYCAAAAQNRRASFGILDATSGGTTRV
jgi:hypothetical protein